MEEKSVNLYEDAPSDDGIILSEQTRAYFFEISKWTKFLSIMGFILVGIMVILALFAGSLFSQMPFNQFGQSSMGGFGFIFTIIYLLMALLYFFPTLYLFRFSTKMQIALQENNSVEFEDALGNHKSFYKFWGIFTIILLGLYALMFIGGLMTSAIF